MTGRRPRMPIAVTLMIGTSIPLAVVMVIAFRFAEADTRREVVNDVERTSLALATHIARRAAFDVAVEDRARLQWLIDDVAAVSDELVACRIVSPRAGTLSDWRRTDTYDPWRRLHRGADLGSEQGVALVAPVVYAGDTIGSVHVVASLDHAADNFAVRRRRSLLTFLVLFLCSNLICLAVGTWMRHRILRLGRHIAGFGKKRRFTTAPAGADELGDLGRAFDQMARRTLEGRHRALGSLRKRNRGLAERAERAEAANRAKSEFLAGISHDLRAPLRGLLASAGFGLERYETSGRERLRGYFEDICRDGETLLDLLDDLLDLAKLEAGRLDLEPRTADPVPAIRNAADELEPLSTKQGVRIELDLAGDVPPVSFDRDRLEQVTRNLLANAIKHSPRNEAVTVCLLRDDDTLRISIRDRGPGIPADELPHLFDKVAHSAKTPTGAPDTGLGLSLARELVTRHDGRLWAENHHEGGSVFHIDLPIPAATPEPAASA